MIFQLTEKDREILTKEKIVERIKISDQDPFMNKPAKRWTSFHQPIATTEELME